MPERTRTQLILAELAAAAFLGGLAGGGVWLIAGAFGAAVFLALAVVPVRRRWLYQVAVSWLALLG
ncbi:MAG: hypothetical protein QOD31_2623, partial [Pseudonocardiales bacterium]|nr:hypothetical protein [Pseudonocardiales bacterium]